MTDELKQQTIEEQDVCRIQNRLDQILFEFTLLSTRLDEILLRIERRRKERS